MTLNIRSLRAAVGLVVICTAPWTAFASQQRPPQTDEKSARTPAQRKISSQLLYEIYRRRGIAAEKQVPPGPTGVHVDPKGRALVDVRARVTAHLRTRIARLGGSIVETSEEHRSTVAWIPLLRLERLASDSAVVAIEPKPEAMLNKRQ